MKKLFAIAAVLFLVTILATSSDASPGLRHQQHLVVKKDFVSVDFVSVPNGTYFVKSFAGEVGQAILNPEYQEWRMPVLNDPYRYRSQRWIRENNIKAKANYDKIFESNQPASLKAVKLC